jgi:hypothetical protein
MTYPRIVAAILLTGFLALCLNQPPAQLLASDSNLRTDVKIMFAAQTITATTTVTATPQFTAIGQSKDMSIQVRGVTAGITATNCTIRVLCSIDETNFVVPETGGTIITLTDDNWHVVAVSVPFCKRVQLQATNNATPDSVDIDAILASQ